MAEGKKASDLFIECLEEEGCEYIFGVPGEENLDFLDSLSRSKKIKLILTRHEQGAGFMAATYGRHTGKAGVSLATLGPGATNLVTAGAFVFDFALCEDGGYMTNAFAINTYLVNGVSLNIRFKSTAVPSSTATVYLGVEALKLATS